MLEFPINAPLQKITDPDLLETGVNLWVKREDLIHPELSGNKWRKLNYNLKAAKEKGYTTILTFGGAYSNHIAATAYAGHLFGFETIGVIRGEKPENPSQTLINAQKQGMELVFVSREDYKREEEIQFIQELSRWVKKSFYLIEEGGANEYGVIGCEEIIREIDIRYDYICCPCGTATTIAGISRSLETGKVLGFSSLKGGEFLEENIKKYSSKENWEIIADYHFGGYAKVKPELLDFMSGFESRNRFLLDPVYTGKMMFGIYDMIKTGYFKKGQTVIAVHTGGLQGRLGFGI